MLNTDKNKPESTWLSLLFNVILPVLILNKGHKWFALTPTSSLLVAIVFPLVYGTRDLIAKKRYNLLSIIGLVGILLTGGIGLLQLPKEWVAYKEAFLPLVMGVAVYISADTAKPFMRLLLFSSHMVDTSKVEAALQANNAMPSFDKAIKKTTRLASGSFFLSAVLNFFLARVFIHSETGTQHFNEELGRMTAWSFLIIAVPCTVITAYALWVLLKELELYSRLPLEEILKQNS